MPIVKVNKTKKPVYFIPMDVPDWMFERIPTEAEINIDAYIKEFSMPTKKSYAKPASKGKKAPSQKKAIKAAIKKVGPRSK